MKQCPSVPGEWVKLTFFLHQWDSQRSNPPPCNPWGGWRETPPRMCKGPHVRLPHIRRQKLGTRVRLSINTTGQRLSARHKVHKCSPLCDVGSWFIQQTPSVIQLNESEIVFYDHYQRACVKGPDTSMIAAAQDEEVLLPIDQMLATLWTRLVAPSTTIVLGLTTYPKQVLPFHSFHLSIILLLKWNCSHCSIQDDLFMLSQACSRFFSSDPV